MKFLSIIFLLVICLTNCNNNREKSPIIDNNYNDETKKKIKQNFVNFEKTEVICNTVYKDKKYKFTLTNFDTASNDPNSPNTLFTFEKILKDRYETIFIDSLYCELQEIEFERFTIDNIKGVLIKNNRDFRSNWTNYLYLVDTSEDKLKKIKGFEEIKNPKYESKYNIIDNYVLSGRNWTNFYRIQGDSIKDFDNVIYDDDIRDDSYLKKYKNAIKTVLKKE